MSFHRFIGSLLAYSCVSWRNSSSVQHVAMVKFMQDFFAGDNGHLPEADLREFFFSKPIISDVI